MKNKLFFPVISLLFACNSNQADLNTKAFDNNIRSLQELVNEGLISSESFYRVYQFSHGTDLESGLVLILPSSSCFNCFKDLNILLEYYYKQYCICRLN